MFKIWKIPNSLDFVMNMEVNVTYLPPNKCKFFSVCIIQEKEEFYWVAEWNHIVSRIHGQVKKRRNYKYKTVDGAKRNLFYNYGKYFNNLSED